LENDDGIDVDKSKKDDPSDNDIHRENSYGPGDALVLEVIDEGLEDHRKDKRHGQEEKHLTKKGKGNNCPDDRKCNKKDFPVPAFKKFVHSYFERICLVALSAVSKANPRRAR
jgi:hypothetical protein